MNDLKKFKWKSKSGTKVLTLHSDWTAEHVQLEAAALVRTQLFCLTVPCCGVIINTTINHINQYL